VTQAAEVQQVRHVRAGPNDVGQRIDNFLMRQLPGVPKSHVYRLLRSGQVRINGGRAKPERKLMEGDEVRLPPVRIASRDEPQRVPDPVLDRLRAAIVFEDENYLAIDKPTGLAAHGGSGLAFGAIEALRQMQRYPFIELAHRLDRDTSGVLLFAKSRPALLRAQSAFREALANKRYFALLVGRLRGETIEVDAALARQRLAGGERYVELDEEDGRPSVSHFHVRERYRDATLCEVEIFSGRTHQIRVHALSLGHPVAGDRKYGDREQHRPLREQGLKRMFLHSQLLELPAADGFSRLVIHSSLPEELRSFAAGLAPL